MEFQMRNKTFISSMVGVAAAVAVAGSAMADMVSIDFEGYAAGNVAGGTSSQAPGNGNWWLPDNSATSGRFASGIGRGGSMGLVVGNRGNGFDGVIDNVKTPELNYLAGETSTGAQFKTFTSSYWFRTASNTYSSGFGMKSEAYGPDRTTWCGFFADGNGGIQAEAYGIAADANLETGGVFATGLQFGQWYRVALSVTFVDGGVANDIVTHSVFNEAGTLMGTTTITSWEEGVRQLGYNGGQIFGLNKMQFQCRGASAGDQAYIDDITYSSVPAPGAIAMLGLAGLASRRRRA
jgi:MYXO-CTERM domain-containing protein